VPCISELEVSVSINWYLIEEDPELITRIGFNCC